MEGRNDIIITADAVCDGAIREYADHFLGFAEKVFNEW